MLNTHRPLLEVQGLKKYFPVKKGVFSKVSGWIKAVDAIDFNIDKGETFGLVGESGCGKSTTAKTILLIEPPTDGTICFEGRSITGLSTPEKRKYWKSVQAVLQDPSASLSPRLRIGSIISEPLKVKSQANKAIIGERVTEVLRAVGLRAEHAGHFPHEFSGGQKQRIAIARALSTSPKMIILDEPISSLDVSIRAQVMNLLQRLQEKMGISYLLIAHDLAVVLHMSSKVGVMYVGRMVESVDSTELYRHPVHPYTRALFAGAFHQIDDYENGDVMLPGEVPNPLNPPSGCRFNPRCLHAMPVCREAQPSMIEVAGGHYAACHLIEKYGA